MVRRLFSTIWVPAYIYMILPAISVILGCIFMVASLWVSSNFGVFLSSVIITYGSLIICVRRGL